MSKMMDEIYEEIQREDLFRKGKKYLPFILVSIFMILGGAIGYTWLENRRERELILDEKIYQEALLRLEKKELSRADSLLDSLCQPRGRWGRCSSMKGLALLQKIKVHQADFLLTGSKKALEGAVVAQKRVDAFQLSLPMQHFLQVSHAFLCLSQPQERMEDFMSPHSVWYGLGLAWSALRGYETASKAAASPAFSSWYNIVHRLGAHVPRSMHDLARYCTLGSLPEFSS